MSARLIIPVTGRRVTDPWWIRLEQEAIEDDSATVTEAANLIDTLYGLSACEATDGLTVITDPDTDTTDEVVETTISSVACSYDQDANIDLQLRVYRSDPSEEYVLRLQGGAIRSVETISSTITSRIAVKNAASITLDAPVLGDFSAVWGGGAAIGSDGLFTPTITRVGNTLDFGGVTVKSGTIFVTYATEYDRCTVTVLGVDGEPGECTARAFFHGLVDEMDLDVPEPADELGTCMIRWEVPTTPHKVECYRDVYVSKKCQCSHEEIDSYTYEEVVDCPDKEIRCPGALTECRNFLGTVVAHEYVACAGEHDYVSDPEYYERVCCEAPAVALPQCLERKTIWKGGLPIEGGVQMYRDLYGDNVEIVPVSPPGGICGEWTLRQQINAQQCGSCDDVDPLVWDDTVAPEVMSPSSTATIAVTGGRFPITWTVDGEGFQFQASGSQQLTTNAREVTLSALAGACGTATITVDDGCSTASGTVRSSTGSWNDCYFFQFQITASGTSYSAQAYLEDGGHVCKDATAVRRLYYGIISQTLLYYGGNWFNAGGCVIAGFKVSQTSWDAALAAMELQARGGTADIPASLEEPLSQYSFGGIPCAWGC